MCKSQSRRFISISILYLSGDIRTTCCHLLLIQVSSMSTSYVTGFVLTAKMSEQPEELISSSSSKEEWTWEGGDIFICIDGASGKETACQARDTRVLGSIPGLDRSPGGGPSNLSLPYSHRCTLNCDRITLSPLKKGLILFVCLYGRHWPVIHQTIFFVLLGTQVDWFPSLLCS